MVGCISRACVKFINEVALMRFVLHLVIKEEGDITRGKGGITCNVDLFYWPQLECNVELFIAPVWLHINGSC